MKAMAARDESRFRTDRYGYNYDDARFYEKPHKLTLKYNSDDERERRRQCSEKRRSSAQFQQLSVHGSTERAASDTRLSHSRQFPSPPPLNRNRKYEAWRSEIPSPTFAQPPIPDIIVSKASTFSGPRPRHSDRPWTKSSPARNHTDTTNRLDSPASYKTYQHEELRPLEFRLVRLFSKRMSTVKCEIVHSSLTDPPRYTAISYAWGDPDDKRSIQMGDINISIAVSLFGALDAVRKREEDILVWADALCIDQQNRDERSEQVQLMTEIYAKATQVAIWLGPSENDSELAKDFLQDIIITENDPKEITNLLLSRTRLRAVKAVVRLFQRDYWRRLWIVQEVFNANSIKVYCGDSTGLPWGVYKRAAHVQSTDLTYSRVLAYEGPNSLLDLDSVNSLGEESLLNVVRACRRKLTSEPRDRIFGVLGVLPEVVRQEFPVNYNLSVKEIYTNVVDFLLYATERLDVICESIHYPKQTSVTSLPSWVPDWSQNPDTTALGFSYDFAAAGNTNADWTFLCERRNELEISAIYIDTVRNHGVAVGTLCTLADYLMAFVQWRAMLLHSMSSEKPEIQDDMEEAFCRTLCLGQVTPNWKPDEWLRRCYRVFATLIRNRLPRLEIDEVLKNYVDTHEDAESNYRQFLQSHFGSRMMGRCFFLTKTNGLGMGTGFMLPDDIIVVPLGCRTPIVIRKEGDKARRFRFVGDVYLDGYMDGQAIKKWKAGEKDVQKFVLV
ncbi:heterokaryon incompatibility protein-domain-containing protein [Xylaria acuta]|nr:heterokaryon incompatibility protein-domain-containing protein [Xylaria acuta]